MLPLRVSDVVELAEAVPDSLPLTEAVPDSDGLLLAEAVPLEDWDSVSDADPDVVSLGVSDREGVLVGESEPESEAVSEMGGRARFCHAA